MRAKKILVTGGAGFLGSHLCEALLQQGHHVLCLDNFSTSLPSTLTHLHTHPHFELIKQDVCKPYSFEVDEIYNLACPASPPHYQRDPVHTLKTNVFGAYHALELARLSGARIFQASTSEIYGDPLIHPQVESYWGNVNPIGFRSCYDEGKRCAETLFFDYARFYGVEIKLVRIFNTYGPRMHPQDGRVVSNFIVQALQNAPLTIYGTGQQTRSFCYVSDMIDGFLRCMESDSLLTGPFNLGNPHEFTILELAEKILKETASRSELIFLPLPSDDPKQRNPDITQARTHLQWEPKVSLEEGIKLTAAYFQSAMVGSIPTNKVCESLCK